MFLFEVFEIGFGASVAELGVRLALKNRIKKNKKLQFWLSRDFRKKLLFPAKIQLK